MGVEIDQLMFDSIVHGIERDKKMFKTKLWLNKNAFFKENVSNKEKYP